METKAVLVLAIANNVFMFCRNISGVIISCIFPNNSPHKIVFTKYIIHNEFHVRLFIIIY